MVAIMPRPRCCHQRLTLDQIVLMKCPLAIHNTISSFFIINSPPQRHFQLQALMMRAVYFWLVELIVVAALGFGL